METGSLSQGNQGLKPDGLTTGVIGCSTELPTVEATHILQTGSRAGARIGSSDGLGHASSVEKTLTTAGVKDPRRKRSLFRRRPAQISVRSVQLNFVESRTCSISYSPQKSQVYMFFQYSFIEKTLIVLFSLK
ncbi:uncharacterized protein LOC124373544 [Homalodisca vitripennis]|uniref:uncharacterized protein LOC124373544 n=1 Tax=Homalodisca vitripennis TaxID=197043 RepID=UPI001EEB5D5C|nr:uncharacterized protein LOC124373544 [Homalodisca vitripennis]